MKCEILSRTCMEKLEISMNTEFRVVFVPEEVHKSKVLLLDPTFSLVVT
jgi:hypothetical protein